MKRANYVISALTCAFAIVFLVVGRMYTTSLDGISTSASWPNILSWLLLGLGIFLAVWNTFSKNIPASKIDFKSYSFHNVLIVMAAVVLLLIVFHYLGCIISLGIFFPLFMLYLGERNWKILIAYDVISLLVIYLAFEKLLSSPLARPFFM